MTFFNNKHIESNQTSEIGTLKKNLTKSGSTLKFFVLNTFYNVLITQNVCCILEPFRKEPSLSDSNEESEKRKEDKELKKKKNERKIGKYKRKKNVY